MRRLSALALCLVLIAATAAAEVIVESGSEEEFPAALTLAQGNDTVQLRATGTGLRKKAWFKVYAACFYVRADQALGEDPYGEFIHGDFERAITMRFLRDVGAEKIAGAFQDGIRKTLPEGHDEAVASFVGFFTKPVKKGDELALRHGSDGTLRAYQDGEELGGIADPEVIAAVWATWFGEDPISKDLKRGLAGL